MNFWKDFKNSIIDQFYNISTSSSANNNEGFELITLKQLFTNAERSEDNRLFNYHRINSYAILIITKGRGVHDVDFEQYPLIAGDCLLISPDRIRRFNLQNHLEGYLVLFPVSFFDRHYSADNSESLSQLFNIFTAPTKYTAREINDSFLVQIRQELKSKDFGFSEPIIASVLSIFLFKLKALNQVFTKPSDQQNFVHFNRFTKMVTQQFHQSRNAKIYADQLNISYKHLNELCKQFTQKTAKTIIDEYLLLEMKRLLSSTDLPIKEIAKKCGFEDPTNFVKYFKKFTALTPAKFRVTDK